MAEDSAIDGRLAGGRIAGEEPVVGSGEGLAVRRNLLGGLRDVDDRLEGFEVVRLQGGDVDGGGGWCEVRGGGNSRARRGGRR